MHQKINRDNFQFSIFNFHLLTWLLVISLLVYSRFVNLGWGLPYPMHPDERNMAVAMQQLECKAPLLEFKFPTSLTNTWEPVTSWIKVLEPFDIFNCFNPHFFAYGKFPLYLGYIFVYLMKLFDGDLATLVSLQEAIFSLRLISAIASVLTAIILFKIIRLITKDRIHLTSGIMTIVIWVLIVFSPYAIQSAHFGTTESLLMLFQILLIYFSLLLMEGKSSLLFYVFNGAVVTGLSLATKISSAVFIFLPLIILLYKRDNKFPRLYTMFSKVFDIVIYCIVSFLVFILFSPHNFLNMQDFVNSIKYESDIALGNYVAFYTRQFGDTIPIIFQLIKIFPYAFGPGLTVIFILGFLFLSWGNKKINLMRVTFLVYFLANAFLFAKWTRFMAPVFPLMLILAILFLFELIHQFNQRILAPVFKGKSTTKLVGKFISFLMIGVLTVFIIIPGIRYLNVYLKPDTRFQATEWINNNIPAGSYILSETANVVDIPLENNNNLNVVSFNFYDLDDNPILQEELNEHLKKADYIFVPSRRIFANHYCQENFQFSIFNFQSIFNNKCLILKQKYPLLNQYYANLFSGKLGYEKVVEFSGELGDEQAEETWSVFDHPMIRIYKRVKSL